MVGDHQENYYKALEASGSASESTTFIEFMLEVILEAIQKILAKDVPLKRAAKIIAIIQENQAITILKIAIICKVSEKTIKRDLARLKADNLITRIGSLKSGHWAILNDT